jgi:hypothetical protein
MAKKRVKHNLMLWPGTFTHSLVLALAIGVSALFSAYLSAAGILILGSLIASAVILMHKHRHHLTTLGTITFSYVIASLFSVGMLTVLALLGTPFESQAIICVVVAGFLLYWLNLFHPPALAFAMAYLGFEKGIAGYLLVLVVSLACFVLIRLIIYMLYEHLSLKHFIHEFVREEEKLLIKEEKRIKKKLKKSK